MEKEDVKKRDKLIQEIHSNYCFLCGTQQPYCCCIYDTAIKKLQEIEELDNND